MVRKAARTVKSLEKPQTESSTTRRSKRLERSESESESEEAVTVSNEKNEISEHELDQECEKKTRKSSRSAKSKKSHRRKDKSPNNDVEGDEAVTERKSKKGKSKDKHKRKSHNVNDTEFKNDNVQGANQSPFQDETVTSNLTETSNLEEPQPDKHNDDSVDIQPTENVEFNNAVNVEENVSQSEETITADPVGSQSPSNVMVTQASNEYSHDSIFKSTTPFKESANNEPSETEENQNKSSTAHEEIAVEASQQNDKLLEPPEETNQENNKESSESISKSEESTPGKRIQLKRNISEKKDKFVKLGNEKSEIDTDQDKHLVAKDETVEATTEATTHLMNHEDKKKESKSIQKITLKRPSDAKQTLTEEPKTPVAKEEIQEDSQKLVEKKEILENSAKQNNPAQNTEELEEGEWTSIYETNGQEGKANEDDDKKYSSRKISLKRRTTTEEKDRSERSRDKAERSVSVKESTRRRSLRESETDFEIKKRPTKERRTSEMEEKIVIKPKKPTKVVKINRAVLTPVPKRIENDSESPEETETQQAAENKQESSESSFEKGPAPKKYKWGDSESKIRVKSLNFEIVKEVCPTVKFLKEDEVNLELSPLEKKRLELEQRKQLALERKQQGIEEVEIEDEVIPIEERENILSKNRTISIVDDTASKLKPPPSPAKNPLSNILHVSNLVRPFTVKQLKDLLERTGTIKEDGFWTDKIKSKCYAVYETTEEAEATRNALHGVNWPIGNGKQLVIEYATEEEMERAKNPPPPVRRERAPEKENQIPDTLDDVQIKDGDTAATTRDWDSRRRDSGGDRMRELDGQHRKRHSGGERDGERRHRSRSKSRERARKHIIRRSISPEDHHHHHKRKKPEEAVEQKAMDDLFMKTKATPSIYWQPLSPEEIAQKQRQREARLEENRRRMEERRPPQHTSTSGFRDRNFRRR